MATQEVIRIDKKSFALSDTVAAVGGVDVSYCYQCGKCATGCPVAYEMDRTPTQLIHAIQLGLTDVVFSSKTMWLCASCLTCSTRCPQNVDVAEILNTVKILMQRDRKEPRLPIVLKFNQSFIGNLRLFGRLHELTMAIMLKLATLNFTQDVSLAIKMLKKGKFRIFPQFKGSRVVRKIFRRARKRAKA